MAKPRGLTGASMSTIINPKYELKKQKLLESENKKCQDCKFYRGNGYCPRTRQRIPYPENYISCKYYEKKPKTKKRTYKKSKKNIYKKSKK